MDNGWTNGMIQSQLAVILSAQQPNFEIGLQKTALLVQLEQEGLRQSLAAITSTFLWHVRGHRELSSCVR